MEEIRFQESRRALPGWAAAILFLGGAVVGLLPSLAHPLLAQAERVGLHSEGHRGVLITLTSGKTVLVDGDSPELLEQVIRSILPGSRS